jgi:GDP-4-dehydro-6-deoxy-D-mannose reductase
VSLPKILITGANGFTGRHAIDYFTHKDFDVVAVVRTKTVFQRHLDHSIEECDLTNEQAVNNLIKRIKPGFILHLAGKNSVEESWNTPAYYILTNTMSTLFLLEAIRKHCTDAKTLIVGSALQYNPCSKPSPLHPYSVSKGLQALVANSWKDLFKLDLTIAKPSNLIGPGVSNGVCSIFAQKIPEMEQGKIAPILNVSDLLAKRDFLDVRDAVRAYEYLLKMKTNEDEYEICSGIPRTLEEVIKTFQSLTKIKLVIENQQAVAKQVSPMMDNHKMSALNWKPLIPFEKSLKDTLEFYRMNQFR